jgi:hypothetical protein
MKTVSYFIFLCLLVVICQSANSQTIEGKAYLTGSYIFCGAELPKNFSYLIEKQTGANSWNPVAELKAPKSEAECKATFMKLPAAVASITRIEPAIINFVWEKILKSGVIDSLYAYKTDPRYQFMAGTGWFDDGISQPGRYTYRVKRLGKDGKAEILKELTVNYPQKQLNVTVSPVRYTLNESSISISYEMDDLSQVAGLKLFRSMYLQKSFAEVPANLMFTSQDGKMVAQFIDNSATKGLTYSYVAQAYDGLGNTGNLSDTLNIYNIAKKADIGMITNLQVTSVPEKQGNQLKWSYDRAINVNTVEIFRSKQYEGNYQRIISMGSKQTEYFDQLKIDPAETYFYYISINNGFENSLPSARVPAILEGKKKNVISPQGLVVSRKDNVVTLKFTRIGNDIRSYYIYRADGYTSPLAQLPRMLLSTDSLLTYNDTLALSVTPSVYSYAVASVNTSYNISPMSDRASIQYSGGRLPVPNKVDARINENHILVSWTDVSNQNVAVTGYRIFRKAMVDDKVLEPEREIAHTGFSANLIIDSAIEKGKYYAYSVQCIGLDSTDVGSVSQPAGIAFNIDKPLQPGEVSAIPADKKIILKWTLPAGNEILAVQIFRSLENGQPEMIKELGKTTGYFEDITAEKSKRYLYFIVLKYTDNRTSQPTDAVSAKW